MSLPTATLVCQVLLVETNSGLALVDTGYGLDDIADRARLGPTRHFLKPAYARSETAAAQIEQLGYRRDDVRHVVITHFDLDHIGGISDFPNADIHVTAAEALGAIHSPSFREKLRYRRSQWKHGPRVVEHSPDGEPWRGFAAAKELDAIAPGIVLIALPGHSRGHACVAVDAGHRWVLHAGDAFYHHGTIDGESRIPRVLTTMEKLVAFDRKLVQHNHLRLAELHNRKDEKDLLVICAHDPTLYMRAKETA
jgi:glyoxylase-like metal-dependent hydrolase (beta-lactamase superfamily II)